MVSADSVDESPADTAAAEDKASSPPKPSGSFFSCFLTLQSVEENFHECYPELRLINPALEQANAVKAYLTEQNALNPQLKGSFTICTSGDPQVYVNVGRRLGLFEASELKVVHI